MKYTTDDVLFFLGGQDLEMKTIKKLLKDNGINFEDEGLLWGAKLSNYTGKIDNNKYCVFIELEIDAPNLLLGENFNSHIIDHHGDLDYLPSSLEQVVDFLKAKMDIEVEWTRDFELIAANDRGYIPAMKALEATTKEIADIRKRDRAAQGVSEEDEALAVKSLQQNQKIYDDHIYVIHSLTPRFSTITDRLYQEESKHILIYTKEEFTYYGAAKKDVQNWLLNLGNKKLKESDLYSGGGNNGFLGLKKEVLTGSEIYQLILEMTNIIRKKKYEQDSSWLEEEIKEEQEFYSYHLFTFPFQLGEGFPVESEKRVKVLDDMINGLKANGKWKDKTSDFAISNILDYNEQNYFHEYVWDSIYERVETKERIMRFVEWNKSVIKAEDQVYEITVSSRKDPYKLNIKSITLQLYTTGVGILNFYLINKRKDQSSPNDILTINQKGRRIFPPFFTTVPDFEDSIEDPDFLKGLACKSEEQKGVQQSEMAIELKVLGVSEGFDKYKNIHQSKAKIYKPFLSLPNFMEALFKGQDLLLKCEPITDDRMFVLCWYGNQTLNDKIASGDEAYLNLDWWHHFVFVDNPDSKTCQNKMMADDLLRKATNPRWSGYGTLIGITDYSLVLTSSDYKTLVKNNAYFLPNHLRTMYHKMVELCLLQRGSLLRFSEQLKRLSRNGKYNDGIRAVFENYTHFINEHYFREVTPQQQGIEIYQRLQEAFQIEREVEHLDKEIKNFHDLALLKVEEERRNEEEKQTAAANQLNNILAIASALFIIPTFFLGLYGMNAFDSKLGAYSKFDIGWIILALLFSGVTSAYLLWKWLEAKNKAVADGKAGNDWSGLVNLRFVIALIFWLISTGYLAYLPFKNPTQQPDVYKAIMPSTMTEDTSKLQIIIPEKKIRVGKQNITIPADTILINQVERETKTDSILIIKK